MAKASKIDDWKKIRTLKEVAERLNKSPQDMVDVVAEILESPIYTRDNALSLLGITDDEFSKTVLSANTQHSKFTSGKLISVK